MTIGARGAAERLREGASLLLLAPLWLWWAVDDGGYPPALWLLGVPYLAAAAGVLVVLVPRARVRGARRVALVALAALAVWSAMSLLWADDRGAAWLGAERTLLYALAFAIPVLWPPSRAAIAAALGMWLLAAAAGLAAGLLSAAEAPMQLRESGRLVAPTGYVNATAALAAMGALPALVLGAHPERHPALRAAAMGLSAALAGALVLPQSRGAVAAAGIALAVAFLLTPYRIRLALATALVLGGLAIALGPLLDVRGTALAGAPVTAVGDASRVLVLLAAGVALAALVAALADSVRPPSARMAQRASRAGRALLAAAAVAAAVAFVLAVGDPVSWAAERYQDFKVAEYAQLEQSDTRFTGDLGSNRYDYWRVATEVFLARPLLGEGAVNFAAPYLERRSADKATLYAHSIWFQTLSDLGLIGVAALLAFAIATAVAVRAALRRSDPAERALRAAAALPLAYLGVHASADWVSFFPGLVVPALALAAAATSAAPGARRDAAPLGRPAGAVAVTALAALALTALPPLASNRLIDRADATWRARPQRALTDLRLAQRLNPLSARPPLVRGILALEMGERDEAVTAFREAAARDRSAWYPQFALGLLAASQSREAEARRRLAQAAERNPRHPLIRESRERLARGEPVDPLDAQRSILSTPR